MLQAVEPLVPQVAPQVAPRVAPQVAPQVGGFAEERLAGLARVAGLAGLAGLARQSERASQAKAKHLLQQTTRVARRCAARRGAALRLSLPTVGSLLPGPQVSAWWLSSSLPWTLLLFFKWWTPFIEVRV